MQRSMSWNSPPSSALRPLSSSTTWYSLGPVEIAGAARPGRDRRVGREFLPRRRARQEAQQGRRVLQRRHHLFDAARTICTCGRVCVRSPLPSLVTMMPEPVSATRKLAPVMPTSAARNCGRRMARASSHSVARLVERRAPDRARVCAARKRLGDLLLHQVDRRRDDVARRLVAELDDVFAEIGLDRRDAVGFEMIVERDLLGDHRLALGDGLGAGRAADRRAPPARASAALRAQCTLPPAAVTLRS